MPAASALLNTQNALQSAATTGNGIAFALVQTHRYHRVEITCVGTISTGILSLEEAPDVNYSGTWSVIQSVDLTALTAGKTQTVHIIGTMGAFRARISTNVTGAGGSVTANLVPTN